MMNDKVYAVQEMAFRKLQAFGEKVKLPKKKTTLVKDINKKLAKIYSAVGSESSASLFKQKFQQLYPEEFDIYSFEKSSGFNKWVENVLSALLKEKA